MNHVRLGLSVIATLWATQASAGCAPGWRPTPAEVSQLEAKLTLPRGAARLSLYDRFYAGACVKNERVIVGLLERRSGGGVAHIVAERDLSQVFDGGCSSVDVYLVLTGKSKPTAYCHGLA